MLTRIYLADLNAKQEIPFPIFIDVCLIMNQSWSSILIDIEKTLLDLWRQEIQFYNFINFELRLWNKIIVIISVKFAFISVFH